HCPTWTLPPLGASARRGWSLSLHAVPLWSSRVLPALLCRGGKRAARWRQQVVPVSETCVVRSCRASLVVRLLNTSVSICTDNKKRRITCLLCLQGLSTVFVKSRAWP